MKRAMEGISELRLLMNLLAVNHVEASAVVMVIQQFLAKNETLCHGTSGNMSQTASAIVSPLSSRITTTMRLL